MTTVKNWYQCILLFKETNILRLKLIAAGMGRSASDLERAMSDLAYQAALEGHKNPSAALCLEFATFMLDQVVTEGQSTDHAVGLWLRTKNSRLGEN